LVRLGFARIVVFPYFPSWRAGEGIYEETDAVARLSRGRYRQGGYLRDHPLVLTPSPIASRDSHRAIRR